VERRAPMRREPNAKTDAPGLETGVPMNVLMI
jgi:hypothetical protein